MLLTMFKTEHLRSPTPDYRYTSGLASPPFGAQVRFSPIPTQLEPPSFPPPSQPAQMSCKLNIREFKP